MEGEIFKPVNGYEALYEVSNYGRVRSLPREWVGGEGVRRSHGGLFLKHSLTISGYPQVVLNNNGTKTFRVHRLVAQAFLPNPENKPQVNHKDGDRTNNRLDNLEWATQDENIQHSYKHLNRNTARGERQGASKLTETQVIEIRRMHSEQGYGEHRLAKIYPVCRTAIRNILNRVTWKHVA